jgi:hypothetical protein
MKRPAGGVAPPAGLTKPTCKEVDMATDCDNTNRLKLEYQTRRAQQALEDWLEAAVGEIGGEKNPSSSDLETDRWFTSENFRKTLAQFCEYLGVVNDLKRYWNLIKSGRRTKESFQGGELKHVLAAISDSHHIHRELYEGYVRCDFEDAFGSIKEFESALWELSSMFQQSISPKGST